MERIFDHSPVSEKLLRNTVKRPAETRSKHQVVEIILLTTLVFFVMINALISMFNFVVGPCE